MLCATLSRRTTARKKAKMLANLARQNLFATRKKSTKVLQNQKNSYTFALTNDKVPWMSGLVSGLQNRVRRFESARNLKKLRNREAFFVYGYSKKKWLNMQKVG